MPTCSHSDPQRSAGVRREAAGLYANFRIPGTTMGRGGGVRAQWLEGLLLVLEA